MSPQVPSVTLTAGFASGAQDIASGGKIRNSGFSIVRGSTSPSLTGLIADPGSLNLTLENTDRRFDPTNTASPYYPDVVPGVPVTFVANWAATNHTLFKGTVAGWPQTYPQHGRDQLVVIQAADAVRTLQRASLSKIFPKQRTGARITAVAVAAGYAGATAIDPGTALIPDIGDGITKSSAWSLMGDASSAEWGSLFVKANGTLVFLDRNGIAENARSLTSQATFTAPNGTDLFLTDAVVAYDDTRIVNDASLSYDQYGSIARAEDLTSQAKPWGKVSWQQNFQMSSGPLARSYVGWLVFRYKNPTTRVEKLVVKPQRDPTTLWPVVLTLELGDRITVKVTPRSGGAQIVEDVFIRGIEHEYADGLWTTTYTLDDADWTSTIIHYDDGTKYDDPGAVYSF